MGIIPEPKPSTPIIIGTGYHKNSPDWQPTIGGKRLEWWKAYFKELNTNGAWYAVPKQGERALRRAHSLLRLVDSGLYLHFSEHKGQRVFAMDHYKRYGHRMRNGEFIDWQSGEHKDR